LMRSSSRLISSLREKRTELSLDSAIVSCSPGCCRGWLLPKCYGSPAGKGTRGGLCAQTVSRAKLDTWGLAGLGPRSSGVACCVSCIIHRRMRSMATNVNAHITGTVWKIEVKEGDDVAEGQTCVILESMKMEMPVEASTSGKVE